MFVYIIYKNIYCYIVFKNNRHADNPEVEIPHSIVLVKKIVSIYAASRLKYFCKLYRQTLLDKNVRKKLSKIILFKSQ